MAACFYAKCHIRIAGMTLVPGEVFELPDGEGAKKEASRLLNLGAIEPCFIESEETLEKTDEGSDEVHDEVPEEEPEEVPEEAPEESEEIVESAPVEIDVMEAVVTPKKGSKRSKK